MRPGSSRNSLFKETLVRALTSPSSLFLTTSGLLFTLSPEGWPAGLVLLAAEAATVWLRIQDPTYVQATSDELLRRQWRQLITRLEQAAVSSDPESARMLSEIAEAQERLWSMAQTRERLLPGTRREMVSLMGHCLALVEKRREMLHYLAAYPSQGIEVEIRHLRERLEQCRDDVARHLYQKALDQKCQERTNYERLEETVHRIDGQLAAVRATFDNMLSQIVRLEAAEGMARDDRTEQVCAELNELTRGIEALEASIHETLTLRGMS